MTQSHNLTIQVDTREKYPLQFPQTIRLEDPDHPRRMNLFNVTVERIKLDTGDYRLAEYPDACLIERKASVLEINKNLMNAKDLARTSKAFARLRDECKHPTLLIEGIPSELYTERRILDADLLACRLMRIIAYYGFNLIWAGRTTSVTNRRHVGALVLNTLYTYGVDAGAGHAGDSQRPRPDLPLTNGVIPVYDEPKLD